MRIKSPIKWAGGKQQIIDKILENIPDKICNYYEPFLGGGSVLINLLLSDKEIEGNILVNDINPYLIGMFKNIQKRPRMLYKKIEEIKSEFFECPNPVDKTVVNRTPKNIKDAKENRENYYYWLRNRFNSIPENKKKMTESSALFIILNKTCFRGIYREGPNGFNVPYGNYKNFPEIINLEECLNLSKILKNVKFFCQDYINFLDREYRENDFIYLDPPYVKVKNTSFDSYHKGGFSTFEKLVEIVNNYSIQNISFLLSNSFCEKVDKLENCEKIVIEAKRTINSKNPESKTLEYLIKNLSIKE